MNLSPTHAVALLIPLILIALVIAGIVWLVKCLKRRERERKEMLDLMSEQNRRGDR